MQLFHNCQSYDALKQCSLVARVRPSSLRHVVVSDERAGDDRVGTAAGPTFPLLSANVEVERT